HPTRCRGVRRSRVVLAPRPWRYAGGKCPAGNGGKKGRFPGESTKETVNPLRGESRDVSAVPVVLPPCAFLLHTGLRVRSAPGFPCALYSWRDNELAKLRRYGAVRMRMFVYPSLRAKPSNPESRAGLWIASSLCSSQ